MVPIKQKLFEPMSLLPLSAQVYNTASMCIRPWQFMLQDQLCTLDLLFLHGSFNSVYTVIIHCGEGRWVIEFGKVPPLSLYPSFKDKPEVLCVPEEVKLAVFELLISPFLHQFENMMGIPVELVSSTLSPLSRDNFSVACSIPLVLHVEGNENEIPFLVKIEKENDATLLLSQLQEFPLAYSDFGSLPISVGIEVGYTQLSTQQLQQIEKDDILVPDQFFIQEQRIQLRFSRFLANCTIQGGMATIMDVNDVGYPEDQGNGGEQFVENHTEAPNSRGQQQTARANSGRQSGQQSSGIDVSGLDLPVVFELERQFMTVQNIGLLAPGYTFALSVDIQAPVTLRVNGKAIGVGRLVDLNGSLGVQVVQVML